jgi:hypothetical protein
LICNRYDDIDYIDMEVAANSIKSPVTGKYYTNVRSDAFAYGIQVLKNEGMIEVTNGFIAISGLKPHHESHLDGWNYINIDIDDDDDDYLQF